MASPSSIPADLEIRWSSSKSLPYFYSASTGTSTWSPPEGLTPEAIAALPGASKYLNGAQSGAGGTSSGSSSSVGPEKVRASHLLIKHEGSRRPSSWKEPKITRTKAQAIERLQGFQQTLLANPALFGQLAATESHCSSHSAQGDLGFFTRGQMQKPFEDATFRLKVGEMSDIVETDSGVHLILRTA